MNIKKVFKKIGEYVILYPLGFLWAILPTAAIIFGIYAMVEKGLISDLANMFNDLANITMFDLIFSFIFFGLLGLIYYFIFGIER